MTLTTTPTTRPSSSTTTTSFDLQRPPSPRAMGPLPVWPQLFGGLGGEAKGGLAHHQQMAEETNATRLRALR